MDKRLIDARGLSCPEPVLVTKKAVEAGGNAWQVLVDNSTALGNVTRYAENAGLKVTSGPEGDDFRLTLTR